LGKVGDLSGSVGSNDNKAADDFRVLTTDCWLDFQSADWLAWLAFLEPPDWTQAESKIENKVK